jgi:hypothetical protein
MGLFRAASVGKDLASRRRRYPEEWQTGEYVAEDRTELIHGEDRDWHMGMVDAYAGEVAEDAVRLCAASLEAEGSSMETQALSTIRESLFRRIA